MDPAGTVMVLAMPLAVTFMVTLLVVLFIGVLLIESAEFAETAISASVISSSDDMLKKFFLHRDFIFFQLL
ncbi:MAG: hypothetical protein WBN94_03435 [Methanothrix sp.]